MLNYRTLWVGQNTIRFVTYMYMYTGSTYKNADFFTTSNSLNMYRSAVHFEWGCLSKLRGIQRNSYGKLFLKPKTREICKQKPMSWN